MFYLLIFKNLVRLCMAQSPMYTFLSFCMLACMPLSICLFVKIAYSYFWDATIIIFCLMVSSALLFGSLAILRYLFPGPIPLFIRLTKQWTRVTWCRSSLLVQRWDSYLPLSATPKQLLLLLLLQHPKNVKFVQNGAATDDQNNQLKTKIYD